MKDKLILFLLALMITFSGCKQGGPTKGAVEVGLPAPEFSIVDMKTSKPVSSSELRGKVIFLHFWATW